MAVASDSYANHGSLSVGAHTPPYQYLDSPPCDESNFPTSFEYSQPPASLRPDISIFHSLTHPQSSGGRISAGGRAAEPSCRASTFPRKAGTQELHGEGWKESWCRERRRGWSPSISKLFDWNNRRMQAASGPSVTISLRHFFVIRTRRLAEPMCRDTNKN